MTPNIKRAIVRLIHLVLTIPILGYIYSPFDQIPKYAPIVRHVYFPLLVLSGLWMWKGHLVRRFIRQDRLTRMPEMTAGRGN